MHARAGQAHTVRGSQRLFRCYFCSEAVRGRATTAPPTFPRKSDPLALRRTLPSASGHLTYVPGVGDYGLWLTEDLLSTSSFVLACGTDSCFLVYAPRRLVCRRLRAWKNTGPARSWRAKDRSDTELSKETTSLTRPSRQSRALLWYVRVEKSFRYLEVLLYVLGTFAGGTTALPASKQRASLASHSGRAYHWHKADIAGEGWIGRCRSATHRCRPRIESTH